MELIINELILTEAKSHMLTLKRSLKDSGKITN